MDIRDHVNQLLTTVSEALGLTGGSAYKLDAGDECILALETNLLLMFYLEESTSSLIINLPVAPLPDGSERVEVLMELMGANYCWSRTEGGTFGLDERTGFLCLSYLVALPIEPVEQIKGIVENLVDVVAHWRREIPRLAEPWEESHAPDPASFPMLRV
ncbi:MAG TPA: type III secretion system chaperone [Verrucomicrobium sp.]|nr:type III secretion system chaperone [Verrucomicrobium sp.]